jgi:hypothetical protein
MVSKTSKFVRYISRTTYTDLLTARRLNKMKGRKNDAEERRKKK